MIQDLCRNVSFFINWNFTYEKIFIIFVCTRIANINIKLNGDKHLPKYVLLLIKYTYNRVIFVVCFVSV